MDLTASTELAMFPLGSVLVPGALLPLQVFEPRYLAMLDRVLAREPHEFGVVLIARGSEVGGGDVRTDVGCVARVVRAAPSGGGRWVLVARGERRIRVDEWLSDAPFPRARVTEWPDPAESEGARPALLADLVSRTRRALALCAEVGEPAPPATLDLADDVEECAWQLVSVAPVGPSDRQRLLAAADLAERLALLDVLLDDAVELLMTRLVGPGD